MDWDTSTARLGERSLRGARMGSLIEDLAEARVPIV
jgi:hypothetical protein